MHEPSAAPESARVEEGRFLARLLTMVRWAFWISLLAMIPGLLTGFREGDLFRPVSFLVPFYLVIILPLTEVALRAAKRGALSRASLLASMLLWTASLAMAVLAPTVATVGLLAALVPAVFAIPYASRRTHLQIILVSSAVALVCAVAGAVEYEFVPSRTEASDSNTGAAVPIAIVAAFLTMTAWHSSERLRKTFAELRRANENLLESERSLEAKVERRTHELAEARDHALEASQAKSTFLANMSHELRTPMNAILGYSEMLTEDADDPDTIEDLNKIHQAGMHLLALINDVLDISKIESGKMEILAEKFPIDDLIDEVTSTAQPLMDQNGNRFRVERRADLGVVCQDRTKLRQSLLNLLSNAAKFTHQGTISLEIQRGPEHGPERGPEGGEEWLTLAVRDDGIGIPQDKLERIFDEFSQADETTTRDYGGTGLGLAISRRFSKMLGGDLSVESQVGIGSTFTLRVPARLEEAAAAGARAPGQAEEDPEPQRDEAELARLRQSGAGRTVLVIDDDAEARDIVERLLQQEGFVVVTAASGQEGLRLAHGLEPAVITLDVMMPEMDGWAVLRALKADPALRDVPVVMLTILDDKAKGYSLGATDYITKPIDRKTLREALERYRPDEPTHTALVVDDESIVRESLSRILEDAGWGVVSAENGRAALDALARERPDLILLDLMMPVLDGFDFLAERNANPDWREIPVIVLTSKDLTDEDRRRLSGRVEEVFEKHSWSHDQLIDLVQRLAVETNSA